MTETDTPATRARRYARQRFDLRWGPWWLSPDPDAPALVCGQYEVPLSECCTSAGVLDWICQVSAKTWADNRTTGGFVRALDDLLQPQSNLCPSGQSREIDQTELSELVERASAPL